MSAREQAKRAVQEHPDFGWHKGTVTAVATAPASVSITIDANPTPIAGVPYAKGYAPTVGDVVWVLRFDRALFVLPTPAT